MIRVSQLTLCVALLCLGAPVCAEDTSPKFLDRVDAGFDGGVSSDAPAPVWITLVNAGDEQATFTLVVRSDRSRNAREVELPAGARRRLCLALTVQGDLLVEVQRRGAVLERRRLQQLKQLDLKRHLLSIDGRPLEKRTGGGSRRDDPSLRITAIDMAIAPTEAACYQPFGGVLLRGVDPEAWTRDQLGALLEHVLRGGTVILTGVGPRQPELSNFLARLPGAPRSAKLLGRSVNVHRYGLGRVMAFPDDLLSEALLAGPKAAQVKQDLGDLVNTGRSAVRFAAIHEEYSETFPEHPGSFNQGLVLGFFVLYAVVVGPVLGIALRRASRKRLAVAAAGAVGGFSLLALVVALIVRTGAGVVFVEEVVYVPRDGPALGVSNVTVVSGGASAYRLHLSGPNLSATMLPPGAQRSRSWRARRGPAEMSSVHTQRGDAVSFELAMPLWDQRSVVTVNALQGLKPIEASLRRAGQNYEVRVKNTSGAPLERALVMEKGTNLTLYTGYAELGTLAPGEERTVRFSRGASNPAARYREETAWFNKLGISEHWHSWSQITDRHTGGKKLAYGLIVVSRVPNQIDARGRNVHVSSHALRIDPVQVAAGLERGYLGVVLEEGNRIPADAFGQATVEVRVARVLARGPAARAKIPVGAILRSIESQAVLSPRQLRALISRYGPGERVWINYQDPVRRRNVRVRVRLAPRHAVREGD